MITTTPDPETTRHLEPQPPLPFRFLWDVFFGKRPKFRLSLADVEELEALEKKVEPWSRAVSRLEGVSTNPQGAFDAAVAACLASPSIAAADEIIALRWTPPFSSMQLGNALAQFYGKIAGMREELIAPVVRRHLEKIGRFLDAEYVGQFDADAKALGRLDGAASGGESGAARTLRLRCEETRAQLARPNAHLTEWRDILGAFLP